MRAPDSIAVFVRPVTVAGIVRDSAGSPLAGVEVRAGTAAFTRTDTEGRFELGGLPPDTILVQVRGIGYRPMEAILEAEAGLRVEIAVKLMPVVELTSVTIEGESMDEYLLQGGFYERQKRGRGVFFDPEHLERIGGSITTLVSSVPGVAIAFGHAGIQTAVGSAGAGGRCALNVILDGVELRWMDEIGLDRLLQRNEIRAVEVYARPTDVPVELYSFGKSEIVGGGIPSPLGIRGTDGSFGDCGTIVIWSKPAG